jgi:aminopeptidase N
LASNLTRNEARERARLLSVQSYQVELDLTGDESTFNSVTTVRFSCTSPGASTFIDLTAPEVSQITLNGSAVDTRAFDGNRIALRELAASNELKVVATCAYSHSGEGLHRFTDPADKGVYMYSDLETFDAHQIYACFDQPDLKATYELTVTGQDDWEVISNMAPAGDPEPVGFGARRWHFRGQADPRRDPAGRVLPPVAGQLPGRR